MLTAYCLSFFSEKPRSVFTPFLFKQERKSEVFKASSVPVSESSVHSVKTEQAIFSEACCLEKGISLGETLKNAGVPKVEIVSLTRALSPFCQFHRLQHGHVFHMVWQKNSQQVRILKKLIFQKSFSEKIVAFQEKKRWTAQLVKEPIEVKTVLFRGVIESSFYKDTLKSGLTNDIVFSLSSTFSSVLDLKRQLRKGDSFFVLAEQKRNKITKEVRQGRCFYAEITSGGKKHKIYHHRFLDMTEGFVNEQGRLIRRGFFLMPVRNARLTSRFGYRRHPVLGRTTFHKGVDLAAPKGTPVNASWRGVVVRSGRNGGYGNYVLLDHGGGYKTAYAHLDRYAAGLSKGKVIGQGQVLGYVGTTGRTTGPHLHFEVIKNGVHINPRLVKKGPGKSLKKKEKERLKKNLTRIDRFVVLAKAQQQEQTPAMQKEL